MCRSPTAVPYHISEVIKDRGRVLLQTPENLHESPAIDVHAAVEVTGIEPVTKTVRVRDLRTGHEPVGSYDSLALCPGASPVTPPLRSAGREEHFLRRAVTAWQGEPAIEILGNPAAERLSIVSFVVRAPSVRYLHRNSSWRC